MGNKIANKIQLTMSRNTQYLFREQRLHKKITYKNGHTKKYKQYSGFPGRKGASLKKKSEKASWRKEHLIWVTEYMGDFHSMSVEVEVGMISTEGLVSINHGGRKL